MLSCAVPKMFTRSQRALFSTEGLRVINNTKANEFQVNLDGEKAFIKYQRRGDSITFQHTEVPEIFRGKGVAKLLATEAFNYVERNDLQMKILCDYLQKVAEERYIKP